MEITSGPYKGYYKFGVRFVGNNGLIYDINQPFMRVKLNKKIKGFNKTTLPYVEPYHYIPWDSDTQQIDIRKMLYALENQLMPSSGNTETFERDFNKIIVPNSYCPKLQPCHLDWCGCQNAIKIPPIITGRSKTQKLIILLILALLLLIILFYILL